MRTNWYTETDEMVDIRLVGPIPFILEIGDQLHERTPLMSALYHHNVNEGLLYFRVTPAGCVALKYLQRRVGGNRLSRGVIKGFDILQNSQFERQAHRWTLRDRTDLVPYTGAIAALPSKFKYAENREASDYYRIVDTPDARIATLFAPNRPTYVYRAAYTCITYIPISKQRKYELLAALKNDYPDFKIEKRFHLPYESTAPESPIQRLIDSPHYL